MKFIKTKVKVLFLCIGSWISNIVSKTNSKYCYDCGIKESKKERLTREHIPAQNLYKGFPATYKSNRITVPGCFKCNNGYSHLDDEIRNLVAFYDDGQSNQINLEKAFRSLIKKDPNGGRFKPDHIGLGVEFNYDTLLDLNNKNFKGLYYHEYEKPIRKEFKYLIITDGETDLGLINFVKYFYQQYIIPIPNWSISGHANVFEYKIKRLKIENNDFKETDENCKTILSICAMKYWQSIMGICIAIDETLYEELLKEKKKHMTQDDQGMAPSSPLPIS